MRMDLIHELLEGGQLAKCHLPVISQILATERVTKLGNQLPY